MNRKYVWVVCSGYDYEGESVEAVYTTERKAKNHPPVKFADKMNIHKMEINPKIKPE